MRNELCDVIMHMSRMILAHVRTIAASLQLYCRKRDRVSRCVCVCECVGMCVQFPVYHLKLLNPTVAGCARKRLADGKPSNFWCSKRMPPASSVVPSIAPYLRTLLPACSIVVDRHTHKNGGSTVRELFLSNELHDGWLYWGYGLAHTQRVVTGLIELLLGPANRSCAEWSRRRPALRLAAELHYSSMTAEAMMVAFGPWSPLQQLASHCGCRLVLVTRLREPLDFYLSFFRWVKGSPTRVEPCFSLTVALGLEPGASKECSLGQARVASGLSDMLCMCHACIMHVRGRRSRGAKPPTRRTTVARCLSGRRATSSRVYCSPRIMPPSPNTWARGRSAPPRAVPSGPVSPPLTTRPGPSTRAALTWGGLLARREWPSCGACYLASIWWGYSSGLTRPCFSWQTSPACSACLFRGAALCPPDPATRPRPRPIRSAQIAPHAPQRLRCVHRWTPRCTKR